MKFKILTLFPEFINDYLDFGVLRNGIKAGALEVDTYNLRNYGIGHYKQVDDEPYGGGAGMLLRVDVLANALRDIAGERDHIVLLSPQGRRFSSLVAKEYLNKFDSIILVCGRYEGVDQRFIDIFVDEELSIGDFVLSGGELGALVVLDTVARFIPGVLGNIDSALEDSFENSTLKYPQYTRPSEFMGHGVPDVLRSGNHKLIKEWREKKSYEITLAKRKDLIDKE